MVKFTKGQPKSGLSTVKKDAAKQERKDEKKIGNNMGGVGKMRGKKMK